MQYMFFTLLHFVYIFSQMKKEGNTVFITLSGLFGSLVALVLQGPKQVILPGLMSSPLLPFSSAYIGGSDHQNSVILKLDIFPIDIFGFHG